MKETWTVKHRDGTETHKTLVTVPMDELARRVAVWQRLIAPGSKTQVKGEVVTVPRGNHVCATYLRVTRFDGQGVTITKTRLGDYFQYRNKRGGMRGTYIVKLDESGATFWDPDDEANCWALADTFCV